MNSDILKVYDVQQAAELLQVSPRAVLKIINSGDLKARKVGREWRITAVALKDYLYDFDNDNVNNENINNKRAAQSGD